MAKGGFISAPSISAYQLSLSLGLSERLFFLANLLAPNEISPLPYSLQFQVCYDRPLDKRSEDTFFTGL